ncbi:SPFH domain / band 7 family domain-containing protein [Ditylenchus destructor]|nr:SPFH domain / band 7 family domain-containing protein [Ditylenchus destructor]
MLSWFRAGKKHPSDDANGDNGDYLSNYSSAFNYDSTYTYNTERQFRQNFNFDASDSQKPLEEDEPNQNGALTSYIVEPIFVVLSALLVFFTLPVSLFFTIKFVSSFERLIIMRLGKTRKVHGPGTVFVLPCIDKATKIDVRVSSFEIPTLHVITADRGVVELSAVVFSQIIDPLAAFCGVQNREQTMRSLAYNIIYNNLVKRMIYDLTNPTSLGNLLVQCQEQINNFCKDLGIESTKITVTQVKVMKQGENQAVGLFNTLLKSDMGSQLMNHFAPQLSAYLADSNKDGTNQSNPVKVPSKDQGFSTLDPDLETLIVKINRCCDSCLVEKVRKYYRIRCIDSTSGPVELDIDLSEYHGWCGWTTEERRQSKKVDVHFTLQKETILSLVNGDLSAMSAYINGQISIEGSVTDAVPLKYLADRAKELK